MRSGWTGAASAPRWYCLAVALLLGVRATSTLATGASFDLPGDGWRSVWQLAMVVVLAVGIAHPRAARTAAAVVGLIYAMATGLEVFHGADLVGAVPVDMRDRFVHPLLAGLAIFCLLLGKRRAEGVIAER
jgi:TRAP-type C4-dicarboxylate transport system permease large subunit